MQQLRGLFLHQGSESVLKIICYSLQNRQVTYLNKMSPTSWLTAKNLFNISMRSLCSKQDPTKLHLSSVQVIDMKPAKPERKEIADPPEIPEPPSPEEPLPRVPVPGNPDVTIPFTPDLPVPEYPEIPIPVKPGSFPIKNLPGNPKPIFKEVVPRWRAPVIPDLATLFTSPLVLNKVAVNYKAEYLMLTSQMEIMSRANNYFYRKCGLPESSILQLIDKRIISKLDENMPTNDGNINNLILAISGLSPIQVVAILSLLQNQIWLISNREKIAHSDFSFEMNNEEFDKMIKLAAILQREVLHPNRLGRWCVKQSELLHSKYPE
ncbi:uncharacterized protein LOC111350515 [Spodoptera litura]|uniref:Uncharacterized protein LOC111350515 n=1 Tax=Spodoptera litura TaxID=69820 RepID=A0A9J7DVZ6_SPOLT|nr:uncharacterized protein LOC111350515 [Spodoptera litura]